MISSAPKNILLLIPELRFGGSGRVFHDHGRAFARAGHAVTECVFDSRARIDFPTQNQFVGLDVAPAGVSALGKLRMLGRRVRRLRQLKRELRIDVCISHLEGADYLNLLSRGREQVVLCVHNSKRHDPAYSGVAGWLRRRVLMPLLYRRATRVVAVSRGLRQELIDYLRLPAGLVETITNFIEPAAIRARARVGLPPAEAAWLAQGPVLVAAGRLAPEKNHLALLPVLAGLRAAGHPTLRLLLLGDGPTRPALLAAAAALGLRACDGAALGNSLPPDPAANVLLLGFQANPFPYVAHAAVSVLPSLTEGFGLALGEALACGVPVASADCPTGPREILAPATPLGPPTAGPEWAEFGLLLPVLRPEAPDYAASLAAWVAGLGELLGSAARRAHYAAQAPRRVAGLAPTPALARWEALLQNGGEL